MIVVDTSVWIDVLNAVETPQARRFEELLVGGSPLALTDVIYTEVLQGLRSEREACDRSQC
jgi:predicted nucleic acid-binding protein